MHRLLESWYIFPVASIAVNVGNLTSSYSSIFIRFIFDAVKLSKRQYCEELAALDCLSFVEISLPQTGLPYVAFYLFPAGT